MGAEKTLKVEVNDTVNQQKVKGGEIRVKRHA
jgi:hypothetical protein